MKKKKFLNKTANYREGQQIDIFWPDHRTPRQQSQQPELASPTFRNHHSVCRAIDIKNKKSIREKPAPQAISKE